MNWVDKRTSPHKYKVNCFNKQFKEVFKYVGTIEAARKLQQHALSNQLFSIIYQKVDSKWVAI